MIAPFESSRGQRFACEFLILMITFAFDRAGVSVPGFISLKILLSSFLVEGNGDQQRSYCRIL